MNSYTIKATTMEEFFASFLVQPTKITGQPAYDDIRQLRTVIYHNAASIPSERGGGQHGHLGMVMNNAIYATLTDTPWVDPGPIQRHLRKHTKHTKHTPQRY
jgi:hypothetical protein